MNTNPFLSSSSSNNVFTSNLYSNTSNNIFKTNNNNSYNPFKVHNNNANTNSNSLSNNNDIFSRIKSNINDNTNNNTLNNNNFLNNVDNPFRTNNNANTFNTTFNNNINNNNYSYTNQNMKTYYFSDGISTKLPICETVGKFPITTFNHDIKIQKDYSEKNKIGSIEYNNARIEYICVDENLKNFSVEEIRLNDYINAKIQYFDKWSNNDFNPTNQTINNYSNNLTSNFLTNNNNNINNNNNDNTFSIFNKNNLLNLNNGNGSTNPFLNNNNNNNIILNNNTNNNPFNNNNNNNNNNGLSFLNKNDNNNIFNNKNNPFGTSLNNNNNKNIFNNNTNGLSFLNNNNTFNNTSNNNIFNTNNNVFNKTNNIFNNNTSNIFNANNNNNIFNTTNQNPFNSIFNNNNNNNSNNNNLINNNNLVNNIFNYNSNNFINKPFEEKIKDPTWVKRNVKIIDNKDLDNCFTDYINDISQVNLRVKEMQYFDFKEQENKTNEKEVIIEPKSLIFNKIILPSDEEILNYNKKKSEEKNKEKKNKKDDDDNNENDDDDKDEKNEKTDNKYKIKNIRWDPINIRNNRMDELSLLNEKLENNITSKKDNKKNMNKGKISGFAEASRILSNFDNNYVDFCYNNKEQKEYILPTEKQEFSNFNNAISNKQSYRSPSINNNIYNYRLNERNNNINIFNQNLNQMNQNQSPYLMNNNYNNQIFDINISENKEESKNGNEFKNNNLINTNSNKTTRINTDEINRNLVILEEDINNENIITEEMMENECKLIFIGDAGNINELRTPILIQFSSIILSNENLLNFDLVLDIIIKNILSIEDIENKIKIPNKEDIYLKIDGKLYSKLTNTLININSIDKNIDEKNGNYYYIYYGFKLKQYPLLLNDIDDLDNKYMTNPKIEEILNPENNYDLKRVKNFEIWNKYGKIIFMDPIDLSGKIIINDIIKINNGNIDLLHERVDKLKARAFLYYDFGEKLEGTFLENVQQILKSNRGTYVNYDNKVLEYTINF